MTKAQRREFASIGGRAKARLARRRRRAHAHRNGAAVSLTVTTLKDLVIRIAAVEREKIKLRVLRAIG